jgi:CheY-like chemotaxis protein
MTDPNPSFPQLRVLFVEDSAVNRQVMTGMLESMGCVVTSAKDGRDAVTTFVEGQFDVVLMDVQMPVMDGIAATQIIRQHEGSSGARTPIIAVTAGMDRQSCMDAGMDDHLRKPVRREILASALRKATSLNSSA